MKNRVLIVSLFVLCLVVAVVWGLGHTRRAVAAMKKEIISDVRRYVGDFRTDALTSFKGRKDEAKQKGISTELFKPLDASNDERGLFLTYYFNGESEGCGVFVEKDLGSLKGENYAAKFEKIEDGIYWWTTW